MGLYKIKDQIHAKFLVQIPQLEPGHFGKIGDRIPGVFYGIGGRKGECLDLTGCVGDECPLDLIQDFVCFFVWSWEWVYWLTIGIRIWTSDKVCKEQGKALDYHMNPSMVHKVLQIVDFARRSNPVLTISWISQCW